MTTPWPAPLARGPVRATVAVPGSKSATNRALVLAALADGPSTIDGALRARDTDLMIAALASLGPTLRVDGFRVEVVPAPLRGPADIDCGLAGTVMRFVPAVAALAEGEVRFDGDERARERPMGPVITALRDLGVQVGGGPTLPFAVQGTGSVRGGEVTLDASGSSQFVSALLLAAPRFDQGVTVRHRGAPIPSVPHLEMTVSMLRERGVDVEVDLRDPADATWRVRPGPIGALAVTVEPDLSNAAPFLAAAAATGGSVTVPEWPATTTQAGNALRTLLADMGCEVVLAPSGLTVTGPERLSGIDVDLHDVGELAPTIAALAVLADSPSTLRGIAHLRGHETDRLAALEAELLGVGAHAQQTDDGLRIEPGTLRPHAWRAYADHRMATAGAVVGLRVGGVTVDDIDTTAKTLPGFADRWLAMLAEADA